MLCLTWENVFLIRPRRGTICDVQNFAADMSKMGIFEHDEAMNKKSPKRKRSSYLVLLF